MTRLPTAWLFAIVVLVWGTTWHAILYQLGHGSPEFGVTVRFALAGALVLALAAARGATLRLPRRAHARLALQGVFMYGLAYLCVYHAELHVPSGLVAVGYSASPLLAGLGAHWRWGTPLPRSLVAGGLLGLAGVALIFWPELRSAGERPTAALGLAFTFGAVALSAIGALVASRNAHHRIPFWPGLGWSLGYGALAAGLVWAVSAAWTAEAAPGPWLPTAPAWWLSLAYLSIAGTVLAFAAFLTLQQRVGPAKAASIGVITPVLALAVSTAFEGFRPDAFTFAGAALALAGQVLMLWPTRQAGTPAAGRLGASAATAVVAEPVAGAAVAAVTPSEPAAVHPYATAAHPAGSVKTAASRAAE
jgi:drug/metabolite transporter (DMT)-like permease